MLWDYLLNKKNNQWKFEERLLSYTTCYPKWKPGKNNWFSVIYRICKRIRIMLEMGITAVTGFIYIDALMKQVVDMKDI